MSRRDDTVYLRHMLDALNAIEEYVGGVGGADYQAFRSNRLLQDGVIRQLEVVGEAAKRLSSGLRERYSHVPWKDITGTRDKLIHDYFGVDIDAVWSTVIEDVPVLRLEIENIFRVEMDHENAHDPL